VISRNISSIALLSLYIACVEMRNATRLSAVPGPLVLSRQVMVRM